MFQRDEYHAIDFVVGKPFDLGWAIGVLNDDETITRVCKGCGATARSSIEHRANGVVDVVPVPIEHAANCPVFREFENDRR